MTPEKELEVMAFRESVKDCPYDDLVGKNRETILFLCDSALRLSAIENAGDKDVDAACDGLLKAYRSLNDNLFHKSMNDLDDIAKLRGIELAELRERLGEAESLLRDFVRVGDIADGKLSDLVGEMGRNFSQLTDLEVEQFGVAKRLLKFVTESEVVSE